MRRHFCFQAINVSQSTKTEPIKTRQTNSIDKSGRLFVSYRLSVELFKFLQLIVHSKSSIVESERLTVKIFISNLSRPSKVLEMRVLDQLTGS